MRTYYDNSEDIKFHENISAYNIEETGLSCGENDLNTDPYELWLGSVKGLGSDCFRGLYYQGIKPCELYNMTREEMCSFLTEKETDAIVASRYFYKLDEEMSLLKEKKTRYISIFNPQYPESLRQLKGMPHGLYVKGHMPDNSKLSVAIVGARKSTPYGKAVADEISSQLVARDIQIISGMARGIDGVSQRAAVANDGATFAILGSGVDICYPSDNLSLYMKIPEKGGIISEYKMGIKPLNCHFPARNRIISGMSDLLIVVEAEKKSGTLITADFALEYGKDVMAVPGRINDAASSGCNELIHQGAEIFTGIDCLMELVEELSERKNISLNKTSREKDTEELVLENKERLLYSNLSLEPKGLETILAELPLSFAEITGTLMDLILKGYVKETTKNCYIRCEKIH